MKKIYFVISTVILFGFIFYSCTDNDDYAVVEDVLPIATNDLSEYRLLETTTINVVQNDTTGDIVIPNTISLIGGQDTDSNGTLNLLTIPNEGTWETLENGTIVFTPNDSFLGNPSPIHYKIKDAQGNFSNEASITLNLVASVSLDLAQVPYQNLSDYNFFAGDMKNQTPSHNVLPYEPASALFTDYAHKKRFVWMPEGTSATYNGDDNIFDFPEGAVLIKTFYYDNVQPSNSIKIIETRLLIKKSDGWKAYDYVWNNDQTEATLEATGNGLRVPITWTENSITRTVNYRIPSQTECVTCHKINPTRTVGGEITIPIGPKPQNLNTIFSYRNGSMNQLEKWQAQGYIGAGLPALNLIKSTVDYRDTSKSLELRARSYLDINCAHCHREGGHCDYTPQRFNFSNNNMSTVGLCLQPIFNIPNYPYVLYGGNADQSELVHRISSVEESIMMPPIGRNIVHEEGLQLLTEWINSLPRTCR